ncbi:MAG TPA: DUF4383 domain-containing protein [Usitatibacter sp.]|nr:DUF4383 domain-containing protein [Usitatibacter sp.]
MRSLAIVLGLALAAAGVAGFVPALAPEGLLFGVFAVDAARNGLHLATGVFGIGMGIAGLPQALSYFRMVGVVYAVLTVAALLVLPVGELMGMAHNQADLLLQAGIAAFALVLGFVGVSRPVSSRGAY